jgi:uncharacterized protein YdeI (YjbR/CyaY-like superfamily)
VILPLFPNVDGVSNTRVPGGAVHKLPEDLRKVLMANSAALGAWKDITPLARNEFICWVEDAKQETTRERRIRRTQEELDDGPNTSSKLGVNFISRSRMRSLAPGNDR